MTIIREKTDKLIENVKEFEKNLFKEHGASLLNMEPDEFAMVKSMLKFLDDAFDIAKEQARVIEETDTKLDELNRKMDTLLTR